MAGDFESGAAIVRELAQSGALPDVIRVSDESETRVSLGLSGLAGVRRTLFEAYLRLRRREGGCLMICGWEGDREAVRRRRSVAASVLRGAGAAPLGAAPGRAWERGRFDGPYLRDELMDLGYMVETLETSHTWSRARGDATGTSAGAAIPRCAPPGPRASSSVTSRTPTATGRRCTSRSSAGRARAPRSSSGAGSSAPPARRSSAAGATITHHHAVGRDHAPYMGAEVGETGLEALRARQARSSTRPGS